MLRSLRIVLGLAAILPVLFPAEQAKAQGQAPRIPTRRLVTQAVDRTRMVILPGNTRPEANATNDRGRVPDELRLDHLQLQLKLPAEKQQELDQLTRDQQDPKSPSYHKWLTPAEYNQQFSLAQEDVDAIANWLRSEGFTVDAANARTVDFSGTAGQVRTAFHTEIHNLEVNGEKHIANMSDPQIPVALAPAVVGVVSLNDFKPRPMIHPRAQYSIGGGEFLVVPADLATIYNLNPLFSAGISGQGQTIVVLEDSDVFNTADWDTFRFSFGLPTAFFPISFTQIHPAPQSGPTDCGDPAPNDDDGEAILDAEWASAAAPSAAIVLASCSNTMANAGIFIALENLLASPNHPAIVSISYGLSESVLGAAMNAYINGLYQQGASLGVSIFVAAGDAGAAVSDPFLSSATHGVNVSGFASTPYNVAVGGTDFGDAYVNQSSTYWNSENDSPTLGSAKSYIPEIPWNDSCASTLGASFLGFATTYGSTGFCNSTTGQASFLNDAAGSGGPSGCATGSSATSGVADGTCAGYSKPVWQSVLGNPTDGVRDIPDVSLFSANGDWGHYYVFCWTDTANGGDPCPLTNPNPPIHRWSGAGGTSFAAPIMAGIQALVNQAAGGSQGNPAPTYYNLAASEYGAGGSVQCNSTLGNAASSSCIFYDVTQGDMDVPCTALTGILHNCYLPSGTYGVLSTSNAAYQPAYGTTTGWDFATGIGTLNAYNLVTNWPAVTTMVATSATQMSTIVGTAMPSPFSVRATQNGAPRSGVTVTFSSTNVLGTFAGGINTAVTDANGMATSRTFTASPGPITGSYQVTASAPGVVAFVPFSLTNVDFAISGFPAGFVFQVARGTPATFNISLMVMPTLTPPSAMPTATSFSCALPAALTKASCSVNPTGFSAGVASGAQFSLTITATPDTTSEMGPWSGWPLDRPPFVLCTLAAALLAMLRWKGSARAGVLRASRLPVYVALTLLIVAAGELISCGGGGGSTATVPGTPTGPSTVSVTATASGVVRTETYSINVK